MDRYLQFKAEVEDFDPTANEVMEAYFDHFLYLAFGYQHEMDHADHDITGFGDGLKDGFLLAVRAAYHTLSTSHLHTDTADGALPYWSPHLVVLNDAISRVTDHSKNRQHYPFLHSLMDDGLAGAIGVDEDTFDHVVQQANKAQFAYHHACLEKDLIEHFEFVSGPYIELQMMADFAENVGGCLTDKALYANIGRDYDQSYRRIKRAGEREIDECLDIINHILPSADNDGTDLEETARLVDDIALTLNALYMFQHDGWEQHTKDFLRENIIGLIDNMETKLTFPSLAHLSRQYPTYLVSTDGPVSKYLDDMTDQLAIYPLPVLN